MSTQAILILDIGTSSTRAMLFDLDACAIADALAQVPNSLSTESDGTSEFSADLLLSKLVQVIDAMTELATRQRLRIVAVAMATFVGNTLGVDGVGKPVSPVMTYADTRNATDAADLRTWLGVEGAATAHQRTGARVHAAYWPARLCWLMRAQPDWWNRAAQWVTIGDFFYHTFFGRWATSLSVASWSGMLNRQTLAWDEAWIQEIANCKLQIASEAAGDPNSKFQNPKSKIQNLLPPITDVDQPFSGLLPQWATRWPALASIPWLPAIGDGAAANLGSGCDRPGRVALTIGTTGAMRTVVVEGEIGRQRDSETGDRQSRITDHESRITHASQPVPNGLWLYRVDRRRALLGGATSEGGNLFAWLRNALQLPALAEIEATLASALPAAHGLVVLPFIAGERAPGWNESARASIIGFSQHTQPVEIMQAALEGIAYRLALIHQRLTPHLPADHRVIASGGALLSSPAWMQIMADVLGRPVVALTEKEITGRGLAVLALETIGLRADVPDPELGESYLPDAGRHAVHQAAALRQQELYRLLI